MKTKFAGLFISILFLLAAPLQAYANIEIKSENIIFYGDVKPEDGKRLVQNLEIYRAVILALSDVKNRPDTVPLKIYAFKNNRALNKFASSKGIAGLYTQSSDGPIFLTVSRGGFKGTSWSSQVALHEYSHHVLHALSKDNYPRWYDEGFANYLSTFGIEDDIVTIGAPKANHGASLKEDRWMSPEVVFASIKRYPTTRHMGKFYGQSWLYVHYMQNTPELSAKFPSYLETLKTQKDPLKAFETAFGISPQEYHKKARQYWNANAFPVASFKASPQLLNHDVEVRELTDAEAELAFARGQFNFLDRKAAMKLGQRLEKLEASLGETSDFALITAEIAMLAENYDKAIMYINRAIKMSDVNINLLRLRADIHYHKLWTESFASLADDEARILKDTPQLQAVIKYFEDALTLDQTDKTSTTHMLSLLGRSNANVSETGLNAVERSSNLHLKPNNVGEYLSVANVMARTGRDVRACDNYRYVKGRIDGYEDKTVNDDFARLQLFEQTYPNICG